MPGSMPGPGSKFRAMPTRGGKAKGCRAVLAQAHVRVQAPGRDQDQSLI